MLFQFEAAMREGDAGTIEALIKDAAKGRAAWQLNGPR
jgi:hypothetical protein